jgi:hypothetical protein
MRSPAGTIAAAKRSHVRSLWTRNWTTPRQGKSGRDSRWGDKAAVRRGRLGARLVNAARWDHAIALAKVTAAVDAANARPMQTQSTPVRATLSPFVLLNSDAGVAAGFRNPCASSTRVGGPRDGRRLSCCHNTGLGACCWQPPFRHRAGARPRSPGALLLANTGSLGSRGASPAFVLARASADRAGVAVCCPDAIVAPCPSWAPSHCRFASGAAASRDRCVALVGTGSSRRRTLRLTVL